MILRFLRFSSSSKIDLTDSIDISGMKMMKRLLFCHQNSFFMDMMTSRQDDTVKAQFNIHIIKKSRVRTLNPFLISVSQQEHFNPFSII